MPLHDPRQKLRALTFVGAVIARHSWPRDGAAMAGSRRLRPLGLHSPCPLSGFVAIGDGAQNRYFHRRLAMTFSIST